MQASHIAILVLGIFVLGFFLYPVQKADSPDLSAEELECGRIAAYLMFENVIERALIRDIAVTRKTGNIVFASSYTFGGIHMSEVAANCIDGSAERV